MPDSIAWIVRKCPDFWFMPSLYYDQVFTVWDSGDWKCPAYWKARNYVVEELEVCEDAAAEIWLINNTYTDPSLEGANCARGLGKTVQPLRVRK